MSGHQPHPRGGRDCYAYLVSRYPAVTHTFIAQEVRALRETGATVMTYAIRRASSEDVLSDRDRDDLDTTRAILPVSPLRFLSDHARALVRAPRAYLSTLGDALAMRNPGARSALWQLFYFAEAILLWRDLEDRGLRQLHVHFPNVASDVALLATRFGNRAARDPGDRWTWSMTLHGPPEFAEVAAHKLPVKVAAADGVVCTSDFARSQVMACTDSRHWDKVQVVRCGVDTSVFVPVARSSRATVPVRVLNVAAMSVRKGHGVLVDAVAALRDRDREVLLTLVGDGPERPRLEAQVARLDLGEAVKFAGALAHDAVRSRYEDADIFCLPSFAEGVPLVLIEAMACGVPAVSTTIAGIPELIADGQSGLLVPPGRADLLADALQSLIDDGALRARLAEAGRAQVTAQYDVHACMPELLRVLRGARDVSR